jgi:hypothetical protein
MASRTATSDGKLSKEHSALLIDEMIITNGIIYSVTRSKVFGLAEIAPHGIKCEIYQDFYDMKSDDAQKEKMSDMNYFDQTSQKLKGHTATGLTQVQLIF